MVLLPDIVRARREESTENSPSPLNERDRKAADEWIREHLPDPDEYSLEDTEEAGSTESYFFLRYRDSATVVHKVAVKDGKVSSVVNRFPDNAIRRPFPLRPRRHRPDPPLAEVQVAEQERLLELGEQCQRKRA